MDLTCFVHFREFNNSLGFSHLKVESFDLSSFLQVDYFDLLLLEVEYIDLPYC